MVLYRGYNTVDLDFGTPRQVDSKIIKQDLINHFHIRKGEKLMNPEFGTIVWDYVFEPLTEATKQAIVDDVTEIANFDPRLQVKQLIVDEFEHGIQIQIEIFYVQLDQTETLLLKFDNTLDLNVTSVE